MFFFFIIFFYFFLIFFLCFILHRFCVNLCLFHGRISHLVFLLLIPYLLKYNFQFLLFFFLLLVQMYPFYILLSNYYFLFFFITSYFSISNIFIFASVFASVNREIGNFFLFTNKCLGSFDL
jgi:hypothetical protein